MCITLPHWVCPHYNYSLLLPLYYKPMRIKMRKEKRREEGSGNKKEKIRSF